MSQEGKDETKKSSYDEKMWKEEFYWINFILLTNIVFLHDDDDESFLILRFDTDFEIPVLNSFKLLQATHLRCWILKAKEGKARREALRWQIGPFLN